MNAREGMRRLGLVIGIIGAAIGLLLCWSLGSDLLSRRSEHYAFRALLALPAVQDEIAAINGRSVHPQPPRFVNAVPKGFERDGTPIFFSHADIRAGSSVPWALDKEGVAEIHFAKGAPVSFTRTTGEEVWDVALPAIGEYLVPLSLPILGFFLPWGILRVLTWIGAGFFKTT